MISKICGICIKFVLTGIAFFLVLSSGATNSLIAVGIILWLLKKILTKDLKVRQTAMNLPMLLFFMACCVSMFNSIDAGTSLQGLVKVLKYFGIYFLFVENVDDVKDVKNIVTAMILGAVIACLDGVYQYVTGHDLLCRHPVMCDIGLRRMTATLRHCNDLGVYLVTLVGIVWALALYEFKKKMKAMVFASAILITGCIVLTFSRGAALAFYLSMFLMGSIKKDKLVVGTLILSLLAIPLVTPHQVKEWSRTTHSFLEFFCNLDRIAFYKSAIQMIKAHPFIGIGINTFSRAYGAYKVPDTNVITGTTCYAHNNYLQMAGETGLVGLGVFLLSVAAFFFEIRKTCIKKDASTFTRNVALGAACGVFAFLLNGLTESSFYFSKIVVVLWFMLGLGASLKFVK